MRQPKCAVGHAMCRVHLGHEVRAKHELHIGRMGAIYSSIVSLRQKERGGRLGTHQKGTHQSTNVVPFIVLYTIEGTWVKSGQKQYV
jgi:hypothetical protein